MERVYIGCATWAIGAANEHLLPAGRSNLERYARALTAAEVNSSFHRQHRPATWGRWARTVGPSFRFSAKLPKTITHERRLAGIDAPLDAFLAEVALLGDKLGPLLVQLPPSFAFAQAPVVALLDRLAAHTVVVEPRHPSWFVDAVDALLAGHLSLALRAGVPRRGRGAAPAGRLVHLRQHRVRRSAAERARASL
jgi:uncharacterized protein YecE (DUF72 family)